MLIENTVGAGCHLGSRFEELRSIRDLARELTDLPIGYCLDTCHLFAAGFNIATAAGLRATVRGADEILGLSNVHVLHTNDSQGAARLPCRSAREYWRRVTSELEGFRRILRHPELRRKPFILETPVDEPGDDRKNLDTLKRLSASRITTARGL